MRKELGGIGLLVCCLLAGAAIFAQEPPKFDSTSGEAILLRYRFAEADSFPLDLLMDMKMNMDMGGMKAEMPMNMTMSGECKVTAVTPEGNFEIEMVIARVTMDMDAMGMKMKFDSSANPEPKEPQFKALAAMINQPMKMTITSQGKVVKADVSAITAAMNKANPAAGGQASQQMDQVMNSSFVALPENPIKAGDTYDAGEIVQNIPKIGEMHIKVQYRITAVSGDLKQVLMEPIMDMSMKAAQNATVPMDMKLEKARGWLLFDVEKGNFAQSFVSMDTAMQLEQMGKKMNMQMKTNVTYSTRK